MLSVYTINEIVLSLVGTVAEFLLRRAGGPDHAPHTNQDLEWF